MYSKMLIQQAVGNENNIPETILLEKKYRIIADNTYDMERWVLPDRSLAYISPSCERITGYTREEHMQNPDLFMEIIHPEDKEWFLKQREESFSGNITEKNEVRIITKQGETRWLDIVASSVTGEDGRYIGFRTSSRDITDKKQLEAELEDQRKLYYRILDLLNEAVGMSSADSTLIYINQAYASLVGKKPEELIGIPWLNFLSETEALKNIKAIESLTPDHPSGMHSNEFLDQEGKVHYLEWVNRGLFDENGKLDRLLFSGRDQTEKVRLLEKLHQSELMYKSAVEEQTDLILRHTPEGIITLVNKSLLQLIRKKEEEVIGKNWRELVDKSIVANAENLHARLKSSQPPIKDVFEFVTPDRKINYVQFVFVGIYDKNENLIEIQVVGRDITDITKAKEELQLTKARYKAILESQTEQIVRHKRDSTILFVNEAFAAFNGVKPDDIIGKKWFDFVPQEVADGIIQLMDQLTPEKPTERYEMKNRGFDGFERWFLWVSTGIFDSNGTMTDLQVVGRDITERKELEDKLLSSLKQVNELKVKLEIENTYLREKNIIRKSLNGIVADSACMLDVFEKVKQVAMTDSPVLIYGETGTGKELIAQAIHNSSKRYRKTMVTVNCAALPPSLIESELFGREKGAYTGALTKQIGRFELAHNSTIFLDEIGELPQEIQVKLLRIIQFGEYQMLGNPETRKVDVRIIAATNKNLAKEVADGSFRSDLFYRLNVFPIVIPPLRQRKEDIPSLVFHFIDEISQNMGKRIDKVSTSSMNRLLRYDWPGNVRELRNIIEYNMILSNDPVVDIKLHEETEGTGSHLSLENQTRTMILRVLQQTGWKIRGKGGAAEKLGLKESTLRFRMNKLGINRNTPE